MKTVWPSPGFPLRVDQCVALCLISGQTATGLINLVEDDWLELDLYDWRSGEFGFETAAVRRADIVAIHWAEGRYPPDDKLWMWTMEPLTEFVQRFSDAAKRQDDQRGHPLAGEWILGARDDELVADTVLVDTAITVPEDRSE